MLSFLFRGLTAEPARGAALFDAVTAEARQPHWYVEGEVPDTLDGRFAVLATVTALALVRLERDGEAGNAASVALTERFIEVMESEHRELGLGDPTLGQDRAQAGRRCSARRTELWRSQPDERTGPKRRARACTGTRSDERAAPQRGGASRACRAARGDAAHRARAGEDRMTDRFAHQLRLDQIRDGERLDLVADEAERAAIAKRLGLAVARPARGACRPRARRATWSAPRGGCVASLDQSCVVTGEPVAAHVDEPFALLFVPEPPAAAPTRRSSSAKRTATSSSTTARRSTSAARIADTLALSLDPYPRSAGADAALKEAGVLSEEQASPFAVLAKLKKRPEP